MANPDLLIDTSIVIEHLRKHDRRRSILFRIVDDYALHTSTIVEFELFAGATDSQKRHDVEEILRWCIILPFTSKVADAAATIFQDLRRENRLIEMRDIFIAATALAYDLPLLTLNVDHFRRIERLHVQAIPR